MSLNLDRVAKALGMNEVQKNDSHVWGTVASANGDGTYQVRLKGAQTETRCPSICQAKAGDRVLAVIMEGGKCVVLGVVSTS